MPLYDLECKACGAEWEMYYKIRDIEESDGRFICPKCSASKGKVVIKNFRSQDWFKPHWNENFGIKPEFVRSRNHLKQLCDKYGMVSNALGDHRNIKEV